MLRRYRDGLFGITNALGKGGAPAGKAGAVGKGIASAGKAVAVGKENTSAGEAGAVGKEYLLAYELDVSITWLVVLSGTVGWLKVEK